MNIYIIMAIVFIAVVSLTMFFCLPAIIRSLPKKSLVKLKYYDNASKLSEQKATILEKSLNPIFRKVISQARKILPKNLVESVKSRLELAGIQDVVRIDIFLAIKFFLPFIFLFALIFMMLFFDVPEL